MPVQCICLHCGTTFKAKASDARKYCSSACYHAANPAKPNRTCVICSTPFYEKPNRPGLYCSKACYLQGVRVDRTAPCEVCGTPTPHVPSRKRRFCSIACRDQFRSGPATFWGQVDRTGDCWVWTGTRDKDGYGKRSVNDRSRRAHQLAIEERLGRRLNPDELACHTCDNPPCVRNDDVGIYVLDGVSYPRFGHLWIGTNAANSRDRDVKGRHRNRRENAH